MPRRLAPLLLVAIVVSGACSSPLLSRTATPGTVHARVVTSAGGSRLLLVPVDHGRGNAAATLLTCPRGVARAEAPRCERESGADPKADPRIRVSNACFVQMQLAGVVLVNPLIVACQNPLPVRWPVAA